MRTIVLSLLLIGCGSESPKPPEIQLPPDRTQTYSGMTVQEHIRKLESELGRSLRVAYPIEFADLNGDVVGLCQTTRWTDGRVERLIKLDSEWWGTASDISREWVVLHEIGHCTYDFDDDGADGVMDGIIRVVPATEWEAMKAAMFRRITGSS